MAGVFENIINYIYIYCTDFVINMANLTGLSYVEVNAFIFCVIWPILTFVLLVNVFFLKKKLNRLKTLK
jgi:hypothetical protein